MSEYTVIQRLLFLVSSLASLSFNAYFPWTKSSPIAGMVGQGFLPPRHAVQHWTNLFLSAVHSGNEHPVLRAGAVGQSALNRKSSSKDRLSVAGDWLAPMIVWFLVIGMTVAMVGFLLGER